MNVQVRILAAQAQAQLRALETRIKGLEGSFGRASNGANTFGRSLAATRLDAFGSRVQWIGRQLEYNFTLPIVAAAAASYKLALANEQAFKRIEKVYGSAAHGADEYGAELDALKKNFVALSNHYGIHQKEVLEVAGAWAAAGASGIALARSVDLTMQTMILGEMNAKDATEALIAVQAQYGQNVGELTKTIATLNMIENETGISLKGLIEGFSRAAGVARSGGVDIRQLGSLLAALTPAAGSAAQAGNALKTIFSRLISPTKETVEVLGLMGIKTSDTAWKSANLADRLRVLSTRFTEMNGSSNKTISAQAGVVSSVIASRWQVNKFDVLMRELANTNGYYQKALKVTSDELKVFNQMHKELNVVLSSNPRKLQIIWTTLQNAAADAIIPMIPLLLYLAQTLQNLVTWFSDLNPSVQKLALGFLFALAAVGPLVRIFGALALMVGQLGILFRLLWAPISMVGGALFSIAKTPVIKLFSVLSFGVRYAIALFMMMGPAVRVAMGAVQVALLTGAKYAGIIWRASGDLLMTITVWTWTAIGAITRRLVWALQGIMIAGAAAVGNAWRAFLAGLAAMQRAWAVIMSIQWRGLMTALAVLSIQGWTAIVGIFRKAVPALRAASFALAAAATGPWGIAIGIAIALIVIFWDQLKALWQVIVQGSINAFNTLPQGVRNALMAVVEIVRRAAMAVYGWFSWMNPWAKHSPSLVENVTTGVAEIKRQFSALDSIGAIFKKAGFDLHSFGAAVEKLKKVAQLQEIANQRKDLAAVAGDAIPLFDKLVSVLFPLKDLLKQIKVQVDAQQAVTDKWKAKLDSANASLEAQERILKSLQAVASGYKDQLDKAQAELDRFVSAPIKGMKAMEDAIFANQMQQKALRLEMMRMEDALGPLDQLQGRINSINGSMELLSGEQANLRNAGAGSDILSYYDDQIGALEQQKKAINDQVKPLEDLAKQIEQLGRQAEMLDLEKSLAFDPLKKQIDDLVNSMQEMPFEQILAGVTANKAEVDRLTQSYNQASAAVAGQQAVVDKLIAQRDLIQVQYDAEAAKLQKLQGEYELVEQKIRDVETALQDMSSAARAAAAASSAGSMSPGAQNFLDAAGGSFPDPGGAAQIGREGGLADQSKMIDDFTKEMQEKTKNMFGAFDMFEPIKKGWNSFTGWFKGAAGGFAKEIPGAFDGVELPEWLTKIGDIVLPPLKEMGSIIKEHLKPAWKEIQPELAKFKDLVEPLKKLWEQAAPVLKVVAGIIGGVLVLALMIIVNVIKNSLGPIIDWLIMMVKNIIKVFRGLIEFLVGVFTGDWELMWTGIKDFFGGIWEIVWKTLYHAGELLWGIIKGVIDAIVKAFTWLYDVLVGHSIIPDMVNAILDWFRKFKAWAKDVWDAVVNAIKAAWDWVWKQVTDKIAWAKGVISAVIDEIKKIFNKIGDGFMAVVNFVKGWIDRLVDNFNALRKRFSFGGMFDGLKDAFRTAINWMIGKWNNFSLTLGGGSVLGMGIPSVTLDTPNIGYLARGGMIAKEAMAVIGEGRKGFPEYVIPTDPMHRRRALSLFNKLGGELGGDSSLNSGPMIYAPNHSERNIINNWTVELPNIKSGGDAEELLRNLEALISED